jgi:hypothetical protein
MYRTVHLGVFFFEGGLSAGMEWYMEFCEWDAPEGCPRRTLWTRLRTPVCFRILSTSLTSLSIFSVCCYSRYVSLWSKYLQVRCFHILSPQFQSVCCYSRYLSRWSKYLRVRCFHILHILSTSLASVSISSVCCYSRYLSRWSNYTCG